MARQTPQNVESVSQSLYRVVISMLSMLLVAFTAWKYHFTCGNDWLFAILKSLGLQCLASLILVALAGPFMYWARSSAQRARAAGKPVESSAAQSIANNLMPWSFTGMALQVLLIVTLFMVFTRECGAEMTTELSQ